MVVEQTTMLGVMANVIAKNPPSIAIALGGIGMMTQMPHATTIFWSGIGLQALWLFKG
jgi:hypothetical protein